MKAPLRQIRDVLVSLRLTVLLLGLSMLLVFVATLDQVNLGVFAVQQKYFQSFLVSMKVGGLVLPVFPGGYTIGGLLFLNLVAAHVYRFKFAWRKAGILLTHAGLMVLLVGELLSGLWQKTYDMTLSEGQAVGYSESEIDQELAITDVTDPGFDSVVAIPEALLARGAPVQVPTLPFRVVAKAYYPNASLSMRAGAASTASLATMDIGPQIDVSPEDLTYRESERNRPAAFVELVGENGSLGTWLVSPDLRTSQPFSYAGREWKMALRVARNYQPYSLTLLQLRHDVYPGTDIPKNFSSRVKLRTPDGRDDREVLIYMNNPLRYAGVTFYQYQMNSDKGFSVLQVVRNPSWQLPYVACALMGLGLVLQFGLHLAGFFRRRRLAIPA